MIGYYPIASKPFANYTLGIPVLFYAAADIITSCSSRLTTSITLKSDNTIDVVFRSDLKTSITFEFAGHIISSAYAHLTSTNNYPIYDIEVLVKYNPQNYIIAQSDNDLLMKCNPQNYIIAQSDNNLLMKRNPINYNIHQFKNKYIIKHKSDDQKEEY